MRSLKLARMFLIAALLAVPVMAISAQSGSMNNGIVWDGASDWPGVTYIIVAPERLPQTGNSGGIYVPPNLPAPGETELTIGELGLSSMAETEAGDIYWASAQPAPSVLPETGSGETSGECAQFWAMTDPDGFYRHECIGSIPGDLPQTGASEPSVACAEAWAMTDPYGFYSHECIGGAPAALPETGFDQERALREAYAQLRHDGSVAPEALPASGATGTTIDGFVWDGGAYVPNILPTEQPSFLPETGASPMSFDYAAALQHAYAQLRSTGEVAPTSPSLATYAPISQAPAPWYSTASAVWDDEVISALAGQSITVVGGPEALPETGTGDWSGECVDGFIYDGTWTYVCGDVAGSLRMAEPSALPQTGIVVDRMTDPAERQGLLPGDTPWAMPE